VLRWNPPGNGLTTACQRPGTKNPAFPGSFQPIPKRLRVSQFYANFLNRLTLKRIEDDYAGLF
jgi:hypothetical protein